MSFVSGQHLNEIFKAINLIPQRPIKSQEVNSEALSQYVEFEFSGSITDFEDALHLSLKRNFIVDYVVAQDSQKENTFTLLKSGDLGQLGIYFCDFCGAFFNTEEGKYLHERAHYFY
ncbi:hypothetical protein [Candidatus Nitrosocosmicus sp. R]